MKTTVSMFLLGAAIISAACGNNNNNGSTQAVDKKSDSAFQTTNNNTELKKTGSVNDVVTGYISLKNALTNDNVKEAATSANQISTALANVDETALNTEQKKVYDDVKDDIKEHAEHIGTNGSNIAHQREHFDLLSQDMIDLVKAAGSSQTLYRDFCPMHNNKKGAYWLSETKDIKNPYYGKKMQKCGEVKEEIKSKG